MKAVLVFNCKRKSNFVNIRDVVTTIGAAVHSMATAVKQLEYYEMGGENEHLIQFLVRHDDCKNYLHRFENQPEKLPPSSTTVT